MWDPVGDRNPGQRYTLTGRTICLQERPTMSQYPRTQRPPIWTRRDLMRLAIALPAGAFLSNLKLFAQPHAGKVKITDIKAMGLDHIAGNCLIRIDTDSGLRLRRSGGHRAHRPCPYR